jgi:hypothetical protein
MSRLSTTPLRVFVGGRSIATYLQLQVSVSCAIVVAMSRIDKLLKRFLSKPKDFTYAELRKLLTAYGYEEVSKGMTAGSRVAFIDRKTKHIIRLHKPHPEPELKQYQIQDVIDELRKTGRIS